MFLDSAEQILLRFLNNGPGENSEAHPHTRAHTHALTFPVAQPNICPHAFTETPCILLLILAAFKFVTTALQLMSELIVQMRLYSPLQAPKAHSCLDRRSFSLCRPEMWLQHKGILFRQLALNGQTVLTLARGSREL